MSQTTEPVNAVGSETYYYVGIRASPFAAECAVFGLSNDESSALSKRFGSYDSVVINGVNIKAPPFTVINTLAELGYKVICSTGEAEILWTLQREI